MTINDLIKQYEIVNGDFNNLDVFNFEGVYIIYDENNNNQVVYVGSAYTRPIKERLNQYIKEKDTGNSLMHAICKFNLGYEKVKDIKLEDKRKAVEQIKTLKIKAIPHKDLEYKIIKMATPCYNKAGNEISTEE